jgi:hypothetical protein
MISIAIRKRSVVFIEGRINRGHAGKGRESTRWPFPRTDEGVPRVRWHARARRSDCAATETLNMIVVCGEALMDVFAAGDTAAGTALDARIGGSPIGTWRLCGFC